jgi:hypothetical protein
MTLQKLVHVAAAALEIATGVALILSPSAAGRLLLATTAVSTAAAVFARLAGIGLFSLGLACWPGKDASPAGQRAIVVYNLLAFVFLLSVGISSERVGVILWPAVVLHAVLSAFLVYDWLAARKARKAAR